MALRIAFVNESTVMTDEQVSQIVDALQIQYDRDFSAVWDMGPVELFLRPKNEKGAPGVWEMIIADNSDQAGALGYHETTEYDDPIGFVFAQTTQQAGDQPSVTASHELLEMLVDPRINTIVEVDASDGSYQFYAKEVCDAVEDDSEGYNVTLPDGTVILVSDFVTQNWFDPTAAAPAPGRKYDFLAKTTVPFQLLTNGYISVLNVAAGPQWTQLNGRLDKKTEEQVKPQPFNRRTRRAMGHQNWKRSNRIRGA